MAEKFHFQPKPVNDSFSANVYRQLLKELDANRIFFTAEDIKALSAYQFSIDDEIKNKQSAFLSLLTKIFSERISKADTMISSIGKTPFNFTLPEKVTVAEREMYPADDKAMRIKLYKFLKASVMNILLDEEDIYDMTALQQKKYVDSLEPIARRRVQKAYRHTINIMLQGVGGIQQAVGDEYCKAIAVAYDPHTAYLPQTEKENFESRLGQKSMVFGFTLKEEDDGSVKIDNLAPGSPAFKSGQLNEGDKIESVQWQDQKPIDVSSGGIKELFDVLKMSNHDKATFKIKKADGTERTVSLWKEKSDDGDDDDKVKSFLLKGSKTIGFLSLPAFYEDWEDKDGIHGCANDIAKEILKLKKENIQGLILDLRYNGGGSMQEAVELAGIFIDAGPVGQLKSKEAKVYTLKDVNRGTIYDGPLMVLVNGYSASASEMVAGTLQDYNRALIVGSPTYGKATAQIVLPMDTTINLETSEFTKKQTPSYLKTTVSQLYRTNGTTAQAKGVVPDIELPDLLQVHPRREADEANVLISLPIESSKYFKPATPIALTNLQAAAKNKTEVSPYFAWLKKYIESEKINISKKDINLKLSDVIAEKNNRTESAHDIDSLKNQKPSFTVQHNSFIKQQMQVDERLKDVNEEWSEVLHKDPYVNVAYDLMLLMIK